jgi:UTP:GlnB (protein PII) uridylyltransferase
MDFRRSMLIVTPTLDGDVLGALARGELELSGRELARHVGRGSPEGIRRAADRLVGQGVLSRRAAGGANLYQLNREHLAAPFIEGLAGLRELLIERLRDLIGGWEERPKVALLFGSVARGEAHAESDLDLLIVRERGCDPHGEQWQSQLLDLERSATAWTGNDARVVEYGEEELGTDLAEPLLEQALADGLELFGSRRTLRRLIASGSVR